MDNNDYLSEEEQFKEIINNEEIDRIKDLKLRSIRQKYWSLRHQTFMNEHEIPDSMLEQEIQKIREAEKKELDEYRQRNKKR